MLGKKDGKGGMRGVESLGTRSIVFVLLIAMDNFLPAGARRFATQVRPTGVSLRGFCMFCSDEEVGAVM